MLSFDELDINKFTMKKGDIKVNSSDMEMILSQLSFCQDLLGNMLNDLSEFEKRRLLKGINLYEYVTNKYIVLGDLRNKQASYYDILKRLENDKELIKNHTQEEIEAFRNSIYEQYIDVKNKREQLQEELKKVNYEEYSINNIVFNN